MDHFLRAFTSLTYLKFSVNLFFQDGTFYARSRMVRLRTWAQFLRVENSSYPGTRMPNINYDSDACVENLLNNVFLMNNTEILVRTLPLRLTSFSLKIPLKKLCLRIQ